MMFFRVVVLLVVFASTSWANYFTDGWPVYVYSDVSGIYNVFNGIAMIVQSSEYEFLVRTAIFIAIVMAAIRAVQSMDAMGAIGSAVYILMMVLVGISATVSTKVNILDKRADHGIVSYGASPGGNMETVSNIPIYIAVPASVSSMISYELTELVDNAFSGIGATGFNKLGFMQNYALTDNLLPLLSFVQYRSDAVITGAAAPCDTLNKYGLCMESYMRQCAIEKGVQRDVTYQYNLINPSRTSGVLDQISPTTLNLYGSDQMYHDGIQYTCEGFYDLYLIPGVTGASQKIEEMVNNQMAKADINMSNAATQDMIASTLGINGSSIATQDSLSELQDFYLTRAMAEVGARAMEKSAMGAELTTTDYAKQVNTRRSFEMAKTQSIMQWSYLSNIFPMLIVIVSMVAYAVGIFVFLFALVKGTAGIATLLTYVGNIILLGTITPSLALVHSIIEYYGSMGGIEGFATNIMEGLERPGSLAAESGLQGYMSDMQGAAAMAGLAVVLTIPSMIATGQVGKMVSALKPSRMKYDSFGSAASSAAENSAASQTGSTSTVAGTRQAMIANMNKLSWSQVMNEQGNMEAAMNGSANKGVGMAGSQIGYGQYSTSQESFGAGEIMGAKKAGFQSGLSGKSNSDEGYQYGEIKGAGEAGKMSGALANNDPDSQYDVSKGNAAWKSQQAQIRHAARQANDLLNDDSLPTEQAIKSMSNTENKKSAKFAGEGDVDISSDDLRNLRNKSKSESEAELDTASGYSKWRNEAGDAGYEKLREARENQAYMSPSKNIGSTSGEMDEFSKEAKRSGKELSDTISDISRDLQQLKTAGNIGTSHGMDMVGRERALDNASTNSTEKINSLNSKISASNGEYIQDMAKKAGSDQRNLHETIDKFDNDPKDKSLVDTLENRKANLEEFISATREMANNYASSGNKGLADLMNSSADKLEKNLDPLNKQLDAAKNDTFGYANAMSAINMKGLEDKSISLVAGVNSGAYNSDGTMTETKRDSALMQATVSDANNMQDGLNKIEASKEQNVANMLSQHFGKRVKTLEHDGKSSSEAEAIAKSEIMPFFNKDGSLKTGVEFFRTSKANQMSFDDDNPLIIGDSRFHGNFNPNTGNLSGNFYSGLGSTHDSQIMAKKGFKSDHDASGYLFDADEAMVAGAASSVLGGIGLSRVLKPIWEKKVPDKASQIVSSIFGGGAKAGGGVAATSGLLDQYGNAMKAGGAVAKTGGSFLSRIVPGVATAAGGIDAAYRGSQGDYLGAAMSAASGIAANVPVVGTAASIALFGAQQVTDYLGVTGSSRQADTPSVNFTPPTLSQFTNSASSLSGQGGQSVSIFSGDGKSRFSADEFDNKLERIESSANNQDTASLNTQIAAQGARGMVNETREVLSSQISEQNEINSSEIKELRKMIKKKRA